MTSKQVASKPDRINSFLPVFAFT